MAFRARLFKVLYEHIAIGNVGHMTVAAGVSCITVRRWKMIAKMRLMVEIDSCPTVIRIVGQLWVSVAEAMEFGRVTDLTLVIG